jgi:hypothetical protein
MASERGSTVVVVLTVCVFALRPRRRVMRVGFVVLVSTILLRRLERIGILKSWSGNVLELVEGNEVIELEVVVGVGVCVLV